MPTTPIGAVMKPFDLKLETVDESFEPSSTGRRTDPIHRRIVPPVADETDWQRTLPLTNRRGGRRRDIPSAAQQVATSSDDFLNRMNDDGLFDGNRNAVFQHDDGVIATENGRASGESAGNVYDEGWMDSVWEKFDDAEKMAIEAEMGSQAIGRGDGTFYTAGVLPSKGVETVNQPVGRDLSPGPSSLLAELI